MHHAEPSTTIARGHVRTTFHPGGHETTARTVSCSGPDDAPRLGAALGAEQTPVAEVMTRDVLCVAADLPIAALTRILDDHHIGGVPVVDARGRPVGVVSQTDVLAARRPGAAAALVREIMMPLAFSVPVDAALSRAIALMACEGVHRVPVVADDGTVVGIVSTLDVVRWLARQTAP